MFHFNWKKKYNEYIKIDKTYWGFGSISTCGNPSIENPFVPLKIIENIIQQAVIKKIHPGKYETYWAVKLIPRKLEKNKADLEK